MKNKMTKVFTIIAVLMFTLSIQAKAAIELSVTSEKNSGKYFTSKVEYTNMTYYYLNVTENKTITNAAYYLLFKNLDDTDYLNYKVVVVSKSGRIYEDVVGIESYNEGIGTGKSFDITFKPASDETGICEVKLYSKNKSETDYTLLKEFSTLKLAPQHVFSNSLPGTIGYNNPLPDPLEKDYTLYYTDDFFTNLNGITKANFLTIVEEAYIAMWQKMVTDWNLCKGVEFTSNYSRTITNKILDKSENVEIILYDGALPFHSLESRSTFDGTAFTFINKDIKRIFIPTNIIEQNGYKAKYVNATDAIYTSMASTMFNCIQQSLNPKNTTPENWIYNGAALAIQSIATQSLLSEYKRTDTYYPEAVNEYLADLDSPMYPNANDDDKMRFALYWRFLYENIVPNGTDIEKIEIFRTAFKNANTGDFADINSYMNEALHEIVKSKYRTFNQSWTAFAEKMLYISKGTNHWKRWFDNATYVYNTPKYEKSYYFDFSNNNYAGYVKNFIENPYGIKLHKFDNTEFFPKMATKNLDFEFLGDGSAEWAVVVSIQKTDNYHPGMVNPDAGKDNNLSLSKIEGSSAVTYVLPIEKFKNKKRAYFSLRTVFGDKTDALFDIEELSFAVVRLDNNPGTANYSIAWKQAEAMSMYIIDPVHENPAIIELQHESYLDIRFTVLNAAGDFVNNINTSKLNLVTENGKLKYDLSIGSVTKENASYVVHAILPSDLPAGLYSLEIKAQDPINLQRYFKGYSPYSLLIHNDYGCSGQTLELEGTYWTGIKPVIRLDVPTGKHPAAILDINYPSGKEIEMPCIVTDDDSIVATRIYFRRAGEPNYYYYAMKKGKTDSTFKAMIPDSVAVLPGCDFYLWAKDNDGYESTLPAENPEEHPFKLGVGEFKDIKQLSMKPRVNVLNEPALTLLSYDNPIPFEVEVIDSNSYIEEIGMYYRIEGELFWRTILNELNPVAKKTIVNFEIPAGFSGMKPIEYFIYAVDNNGLVGYYGSENYPRYLDFVIPAPELISPANGDTIVAYSTEYEWENLQEVYADLAYFYEYYIEVSTTPDFNEAGIVAFDFVEDPYTVLENLEYEKTYYWRVKAVIDSYESDFSEVFTYYVARPIPQILEFNYTMKLCSGELMYLEVITNSGDWNYQWFKNSEMLVDATLPYLMIEPATLDDAARYNCLVTNKINTDTAKTNIVEILVYDRPFILNAPQDAKAKIGAKAIFTLKVDALGFAPDNLPRIEWFRSGTQIIDDNDRYMVFYEEATGQFKMMINDVQKEDYSDRYFVRIIDRCDSIASTSDYFVLSEQKSEPPYITLNPEALRDCAGSAVQLQARVESGGGGETPVYTYQWYRDDNTQALVDDAAYSGTQTDELTIKALQSAYIGNYYAKIHVAPYDTVLTTTKAKVSITAIPVVVNQSTDTVGCDIDRTLVLYCIAEGDDLQYQWYFNHSKIANATNYEYIVQKYDNSKEGTYYCEVWNDCHRTSTYSIQVVAVEDEIQAQSIISVSPNPVSNTATISLDMPESANMNLTMVDELGNTVTTLKKGFVTMGNYAIIFDAGNLNLSSGKYFILLQYGTKSVTVPVIIVK